MKNKGFTLIEILIVIAVGVVLSTVGFLSYSNLSERKDVELSLQELGSTVKEVQRRSVNQQDGARWSMRFTASSTGFDKYEIYSGATYSTSSVEQSYSFNRPVSFSEPGGDRSIDLNFEPVTGQIDNKKVITITNNRKSARAGDLILNTLGLVTERMEDNIVGYWHFDEGSGATSTDASGQGNNGEIIGASWLSADNCIAGGCLDFDGSGDYITLGDFAGNFISDPTGESVSWGAWVKFNNSDYRYILATGGQTSSRGFASKISPSNELGCHYRDESQIATVTTGALNSDTFLHTFCVFNNSTDELIAYVDGVAVASSSASSGGSSDSQTTFTIGAPNNNLTDTYLFHGIIDEVRIYNRALSADEIQRMYNDLRP